MVTCDYVEGCIDHSVKRIPSLVGVSKCVIASSIPRVSTWRQNHDAAYEGKPLGLVRYENNRRPLLAS
jgi:hypothetical protein